MSTEVATVIRNLPREAIEKLQHTNLPANYRAAQIALSICDAVDEVKEISDRHVALATYAKQIKDTSLMEYAQRIHLRALTRIGELLSELPTHRERKDAGRKMNLSDSDITASVKFHRMPKDLREEAIDSSPVPSKSKLLRVADPFSEFDHLSSSYKTSSEIVRDYPARRALRIFETVLPTLGISHDLLPREGVYPVSAKFLAKDVRPEDVNYFRKRARIVSDWFDDFERWLPK